MKETNTHKEEGMRGYYQCSKAWYATNKDVAKPTIMIGMYHAEGGTSGEISVSWELLNNKLVPRLKAFDDGWKVLSTFGDLLAEMAVWDNKNMTQEQFAQLLDKTGFIDLTPYQQKLTPGKHPLTVLSSKNKGLKK